MQYRKCVLPKHPAPFFHTFIVLWILMHDIIMHCGEHFMSCYRNKLFCISFIYFRRYYWPFGSWSALVKIKANKDFPTWSCGSEQSFLVMAFLPFSQNPIQLHRVLSPTCLIGGSPPCFKQFTACPPATVGSSLTCSQTNTVCISTENMEQQRRQIVGKWASAALLPPIRCCCLLMSETARKWPPARFSTIYYPTREKQP